MKILRLIKRFIMLMKVDVYALTEWLGNKPQFVERIERLESNVGQQNIDLRNIDKAMFDSYILTKTNLDKDDSAETVYKRLENLQLEQEIFKREIKSLTEKLKKVEQESRQNVRRINEVKEIAAKRDALYKELTVDQLKQVQV